MLLEASHLGKGMLLMALDGTYSQKLNKNRRINSQHYIREHFVTPHKKRKHIKNNLNLFRSNKASSGECKLDEA
jgi:hypothetical protein